MKVYIAAAYAARDRIRQEVLPMFVAAGHNVTSQWLWGDTPLTPGSLGPASGVDLETIRAHALADLEQVMASDALVMLAPSYLTGLIPWVSDGHLVSGGRLVEVGHFLTTGRPVINVGTPENIFTRALAYHVGTPGAALDLLAERFER